MPSASLTLYHELDKFCWARSLF